MPNYRSKDFEYVQKQEINKFILTFNNTYLVNGGLNKLSCKYTV